MQDIESRVNDERRFPHFEWKCKIHKPEECTARYDYLDLYQKPNKEYILIYTPKSPMRLGFLKQTVNKSFFQHEFAIIPIEGRGRGIKMLNFRANLYLNPNLAAEDAARKRSDSRTRSRSRSKSVLRETTNLTEKLDKYEKRMEKLEEDKKQLEERICKQEGLSKKQYKEVDKRLDTVTGRVEITEKGNKMTSEKLVVMNDRIKKNEQKTDKIQKEVDVLSKQTEEYEKEERQWEDEKKKMGVASRSSEETVRGRNNAGSSNFRVPSSSRTSVQISSSATSKRSQSKVPPMPARLGM